MECLLWGLIFAYCSVQHLKFLLLHNFFQTSGEIGKCFLQWRWVDGCRCGIPILHVLYLRSPHSVQGWGYCVPAMRQVLDDQQKLADKRLFTSEKSLDLADFRCLRKFRIPISLPKSEKFFHQISLLSSLQNNV